jgi:hypothetical protein
MNQMFLLTTSPFLRRATHWLKVSARRPAKKSASVAVVVPRKDRLDTLVAEIEGSGGKALAMTADISIRKQAEASVRAVVDHPRPQRLLAPVTSAIAPASRGVMKFSVQQGDTG